MPISGFILLLLKVNVLNLILTFQGEGQFIPIDFPILSLFDVNALHFSS